MGNDSLHINNLRWLSTKFEEKLVPEIYFTHLNNIEKSLNHSAKSHDSSVGILVCHLSAVTGVFVFEMTHNVLMERLNGSHSLTIALLCVYRQVC